MWRGERKVKEKEEEKREEVGGSGNVLVLIGKAGWVCWSVDGLWFLSRCVGGGGAESGRGLGMWAGRQ